MTETRGPRRASSVETALIAVALVLAGCGSATATGDTSTQATTASCAALTRAAQFAGARTVLTGTMLAGATARLGNRTVLASPARVRVSRYLKGTGPRVVRVETAVTITKTGTRVAEDGIAPRAGQRWKIYSISKRSPYQTSICSGSRRLTSGASR